MQKIDQNHVKIFYNSVSDVWDNDPWHNYSQKVISTYIKKQSFFSNTIVLNAGSAGNNYNIDCKIMYHVDIADEKIKNIKNAVIASIENLPFADNFFDNIVCVGSVLNYCDALSSISELARVIKHNGNLILEYESSWGFEYLGQESYKNDACVITTEYIESQHIQWLYSPNYISSILKSCGFSIKDKQSYHILDGIFSKFMNDKMAVWLTHTDKVIGKFSFFKNHGNNIILHCQKQ